MWSEIFSHPVLIYSVVQFWSNVPDSKLTVILGKADVTLTLGDDDLVDLMTGKLNPQKAFFQGKLKIQVWEKINLIKI